MGVADLAAALTVVGVSIYVLGLVGLAISIRRDFTSDLSTAWYAVSLVPKTVVAGQGVRIWMLWPILSTAVLLVVMVALPSVVPSFDIYSVAFSEATILIIIAEINATFYQRRKAGRERVTHAVGTLTRLVAGLSVIIGLAALVYASWHLNPGSLHPPLRENLSDRFPYLFPLEKADYQLRGVVALLLGSIFLGVWPAIEAPPPLPNVEITMKSGDRKNGWLVAHSEGFWHLFLFDENNPKELLSIPDDDVIDVQTFGEVDKRPQEQASADQVTTTAEDTKSGQQKVR